MRNAPNMPARGLQILDCQEGGSGGVAYAAGVDTVADGHDVLEPGFQLLEQTRIRTYAQAEHGAVHGYLVGAGLLGILTLYSTST